MFKFANCGDVVVFRTGETVPLKLTTPEETDEIAVSNWMVWTRVPVNVVVPVLDMAPLLNKSPSTVLVPLPAA